MKEKPIEIEISMEEILHKKTTLEFEIWKYRNRVMILQDRIVENEYEIRSCEYIIEALHGELASVDFVLEKAKKKKK